jgi:putative acetyltransferase
MTDTRIRDATTEDAEAVGRMVTEAFGDDGARVASLVDALGAAGHARASLVAEAEGQVVGHVQLNRSWLDARERLVEVQVLSPLSVAPSYQGRGVGTTLLSAAVRRAESLGAPAVFLEGDPGFYGARGFTPGSRHGFVRPSERIPEPAFQVALLPAHEGWMTGPLIYCDPFWALDCVGLRDPHLTEIEQRFERGV